MLKAYFENGVLSEPVDALTPGFIVAFSKGLARYTGDSIVQKSGMERPLSVSLESDGSENSEKILGSFKETLFNMGIDAEKNLKKFDVKIEIREKTEEKMPEKVIKIEVFDRFSGKLLPIPQIAVNYIEHSLNTETGLDL